MITDQDKTPDIEESKNSNGTRMQSNGKQLIYSAIIILIVVAVGAFFILKDDDEPQIVEEEFVQRKSVYDDIVLQARAAYVLDVKTGEALYELNPEAQLPLASITKIMTAIVASKKIGKEHVVQVTEADLTNEGDTGLLANESWNMSDLLRLALVASSNDAVAAVSNSTSLNFTTLMNDYAREIGLTQTYFLNESGLDVNSESFAGSQGSSRDVAHLLAYALREIPEVIESTSDTSIQLSSLDGISHEVENTNKEVEKIPWVIASKTGFTDLAGGNLVVAFDLALARPIVAVVLGSTLEGRFSDINKLVFATFDHFAAN